ncbi:MAG: DNA repair protein RecO [Vulcanimicrobiota bacterium]
MPEYAKTEAIVLKTYPLSERDKIIVFLSPRLGKFRAVAKGTKKITSKTIGKFEPMNILFLMLSPGKNLATIRQDETVNCFSEIRKDLDKTLAGLYILDTVNKTHEEDEENFHIYNLVKNCLLLLDKCADPGLTSLVFDLKFIDMMGYAPLLETCVCCEKKGDYCFVNFELGGAVCSACNKENVDRGIKISRGGLKALKFLKKTGFEAVARLKMSPQMFEEVRNILNKYKEYKLADFNLCSNSFCLLK